MDRATLLAQFLDDEALLGEMVAELLATVPQELDALRAASAASDLEALHRQAHHLKGSLGAFGPSPAYDAVSRLESISRSGELSAAAKELDALGTVLGDLMVELRRLVPPATDPS